jgi:putative Ca2+/H+ antiporter (TMEM165/GDT1 family)
MSPLFTQLGSIFLSVFLAELGDKTQVATLLFASDKNLHPLPVFLASAGALVLSSAMAVFLGSTLSKYLTFIPLKLIAGICFIGIGCWTIWDYLQK